MRPTQSPATLNVPPTFPQMARPIQVKPADSESRGGSSNLPVTMGCSGRLQLLPQTSGTPDLSGSLTGARRLYTWGVGRGVGKAIGTPRICMSSVKLSLASPCHSPSWLTIGTPISRSLPPNSDCPPVYLFLHDAPPPVSLLPFLSPSSQGSGAA